MVKVHVLLLVCLVAAPALLNSVANATFCKDPNQYFDPTVPPNGGCKPCDCTCKTCGGPGKGDCKTCYDYWDKVCSNLIGVVLGFSPA